MIYSSWDKEHDKTETENFRSFMDCDGQDFFVILYCFLPFYSLNEPENNNFEKMKKTPEEIILHMCTINDNHMMYVFWDTERPRLKFLSFWRRDGCNFHSSFWANFCPFTPLTTHKIKMF